MTPGNVSLYHDHTLKNNNSQDLTKCNTFIAKTFAVHFYKHDFVFPNMKCDYTYCDMLPSNASNN
jgi:hypothetical protein